MKNALFESRVVWGLVGGKRFRAKYFDIILIVTSSLVLLFDGVKMT